MLRSVLVMIAVSASLSSGLQAGVIISASDDGTDLTLEWSGSIDRSADAGTGGQFLPSDQSHWRILAAELARIRTATTGSLVLAHGVELTRGWQAITLRSGLPRIRWLSDTMVSRCTGTIPWEATPTL